MASHTITLDEEAYSLLSQAKQGRQSFSDVIKERLSRPNTAHQLLEAIRKAPMAEETLDAIDTVINDRRKSPALPIDL